MTEPEAPARIGAGTRIAILVGAAALAWFAARTAIQNTFQGEAPQLAAAMWPASGAALSNEARLRIAGASGDIDAASRELYRAALARDPLLADPLTLAALDAAAQGDDARAERLMLGARARDPRTTVARFWLFDHFVRTAQYDRALDEVGPAMRLRSDANTALMNVLAALTQEDEGRAALVRKLSQNPFWRTSFFQVAAQQARPEALLSIMQQLPRGANRNALNEEERAVYVALIGNNEGLAAYRSWQETLPASYRTRANGVYDGNFAGFPGAQPFNWIIPEDGANGVVRMVRSGDLPQSTALDVRYFGSGSAVLAEQYTHVEPGAYRLQLAARRRSTGATGGRLNVEVRCGNADVLGQIALDGIDAQLRGYSTQFAVPATCPIVRVRVTGVPGDVFSEVEAQLTGIALVTTG